MEINLTIPWPPKINQCWQADKNKWLITNSGSEYKQFIKYIFMKSAQKPFKRTDKLAIGLVFYPHASIKRKLTEMVDVCLEAIQDAGVYANDYQIKKIYMEMKPKADIGAVHVKIWSLESDD